MTKLTPEEIEKLKAQGILFHATADGEVRADAEFVAEREVEEAAAAADIAEKEKAGALQAAQQALYMEALGKIIAADPELAARAEAIEAGELP